MQVHVVNLKKRKGKEKFKKIIHVLRLILSQLDFNLLFDFLLIIFKLIIRACE